MSKYDRLRDHLAEAGGDNLLMTFGEIETLLGEPLPGSAELVQWWHNPRSGVTRAERLPAWEAAGFIARHPRGSDVVIFSRATAEAGEYAGFGRPRVLMAAR